MQIIELNKFEPNRWRFVAFSPIGWIDFTDLETDCQGRGLRVSKSYADAPWSGDGAMGRLRTWPQILSGEEFYLPADTSVAGCIAKLDAAWHKANLGRVYADPSLYPAMDQAACLLGACEFHCLRNGHDECRIAQMTFRLLPGERGLRLVL